MRTSGIELRQSLRLREGGAVKNAAVAVPQVRPASREPTRLAVGRALAIVLFERFLASLAEPAKPDRLAWADVARGLGLLLALTVQFCWFAMQDGAAPFRALYLMLNPLALPAFMVACGLFAGRSLRRNWIDFLPRKTMLFAAALLVWAVAQIFAAWIAAPRGTMSVAATWRAVATATDFAPLLLLAPAYLVILRHMRNHLWFLIGIAVLAELLVIPGRTFGGEMMRGLVYFVGGAVLSSRLRMLAEEARRDFRMTIGAAAIFVALTALCVFIPMPYAGGAAIATLPFASLAIGFSGALCVIMAASLIAEYRLCETLATMGRNWIAVALAAPLALGALRLILTATGIAPNPAAADVIIGVAALAGLAAGLVVALFARFGDKPRAAPAADEILPIRLR